MPDFDGPLKQFIIEAQGAGSESLFPALDRLYNAALGHKFLSCSLFAFQPDEPDDDQPDDDLADMAARIYSSDEVAYPVFGLKEITPNKWTSIVIDRHETFIANSIEEIAEVFPDHEKIAALGLGSVINIPVIRNGVFVGTVNLLDETNAYSNVDPENLATLNLASMLAFEAVSIEAFGADADKQLTLERYP